MPTPSDLRHAAVISRNRLCRAGIWQLLVFLVMLMGSTPLWAAQRVTTVRLAHLHSNCQSSAPVTFGQAFRDGDVPAGDVLRVESKKGALPTQVNVKARNQDGSVRHAILSVDVPCTIKRDQTLDIVSARHSSQQSQGPTSPVSILKSNFNAGIRFQENGHKWHVNARDLLKRVVRAGGCHQAKIYCRRWLRGAFANEWVVGAPPVDNQGKQHPHLMVFFAVRAYGSAPIKTVRVDTDVENDWAYVANPKNETYSATLSVPGHKTYHINKLTHFRQARWHRVMWWGKYAGSPWFAALNGPYLQATPAVPSYQRVRLDPKVLSRVRNSCQPMSHCDLNKRMEATGAQPQIGPLPEWSSAYIVNPHDYRTYRWMLANSGALGAYSTHYRSKKTGNPVSVQAHPCATLVGPAEQARCKVAPHGDDRFPACHNDCHLPLETNAAHHPAPAYVAYLVTGDWYYAQELTFWADWTVFLQNPSYRNYRKGLVERQQVRAQAWDLRTLGFAAYLLPDDSPFKSYLHSVVENNIDWYNSKYADNTDANPLGFVINGYGVIYPASGPHKKTGVSSWQNSFFTWAAGNLVDLGFKGAPRMRDYFSRFQVGLINSSGFCPELASSYYVRVRDTPKSPLYQTFAQVYDKTYPGLANIGCSPKRLQDAIPKHSRYSKFDYPPGTMVGYPTSDTGFVANYQIGLAAAANSDRPGAQRAWHWFMHRPVRPGYHHAPQFAVVPTGSEPSAR